MVFLKLGLQLPLSINHPYKLISIIVNSNSLFVKKLKLIIAFHLQTFFEIQLYTQLYTKCQLGKNLKFDNFDNYFCLQIIDGTIYSYQLLNFATTSF